MAALAAQSNNDAIVSRRRRYSQARPAGAKIVDWYMQGKIEIDPMITHTLALDDINKGYDLMHAGESIRSVVVY